MSWGASQVALVVKNPPANAEDLSLVPGSGRSLGEGHGYPLQHFCLENPMDREARWIIVHRVTKNPTWLKWPSTQHELREPPQAQNRRQHLLVGGVRTDLYNPESECFLKICASSTSLTSSWRLLMILLKKKLCVLFFLLSKTKVTFSRVVVSKLWPKGHINGLFFCMAPLLKMIWHF